MVLLLAALVIAVSASPTSEEAARPAKRHARDTDDDLEEAKAELADHEQDDDEDENEAGPDDEAFEQALGQAEEGGDMNDDKRSPAPWGRRRRRSSRRRLFRRRLFRRRLFRRRTFRRRFG